MTNDIRAEINRIQGILHDQDDLGAEENDPEQKSGIAVRRRFLSRLVIDDDSTFPPPSIFVAYSETGTALFEMVEERCEEWSIEIITGFGPEVFGQNALLDGIIRGIKRATLFLGIWTPDYNVAPISIPGGHEAGPSVWMPVELGIAVAYNKPFRLLIHNSIHRDFYTKIWGGMPHHVFTDGSFIKHLDDCLKYLNSQYHVIHAGEQISSLDVEL